MNCQFIIGLLRLNQLRRIILFFLLGFSYVSTLLAQEVHPNSLSVVKQWNDANGRNNLSIKVSAACNPSKPPFDGHPTGIHVVLNNRKGKVHVNYEDSSYAMEMIAFHKKYIWFSQYKKTKVVFIPFFYCGNEDTEVKLSYILVFDNKYFTYHFKFKKDEDGNCLAVDDIDSSIKNLPVALQQVFGKKLKFGYTKIHNFYSN